MRRIWLILLVVVVTSAACGTSTGSPSSSKSPKSAETVAVLSDQSVVLPRVGASYQFRAVVHGSGGAAAGSGVTWTSLDPAVVSVTRAGLATAITDSGSAPIIASANGAASQAAQVIVATPGPKTVLVQSTDVVAAGANDLVLRTHAGSHEVAVGDIVVSGSRAGVLARVTRVVSVTGDEASYATVPASLAQSFQHMDAHVSGIPVRAKVTLSRHGTELQVSQVEVGGRTVPVDPTNGPLGTTCESRDNTPVAVTVTVPSVTLNATVQIEAALVLGFSGVQQFQLEAITTVSTVESAGSISFGTSVGPSFKCTYPIPSDIFFPTPIFIGPVEIDGTVTPSTGFNVSAAITGTVSLAGPQVTDTITGTDGVSYENGTWQTIDQNSVPGPQVTPAGIKLTEALQTTVQPFIRVDAGFGADLGAVYRLANLNLAFVQGSANLGLSLQSPFVDSTAHYTGPHWSAGFELQAGAELALSGPVFNDVQQFLSWIGVSLSANTTWGLFDDKLELASSPSPTVTGPPTAVAGQPVMLTAQIPPGFSGATVQFEGFESQSPSGVTLGSATVSGTTATTTWTPSSTGIYQVSVLLFDSIFGPLGLPYGSTSTALINVRGPGSTTTTATTQPISSTTTTTTLNPPPCTTDYMFPIVAQGGASVDPTDVPISTSPVTAYCNNGWAVLQNFTVQAGSGDGIALLQQAGDTWQFVQYGDNSALQPNCSQYPAAALQALGPQLCNG